MLEAARIDCGLLKDGILRGEEVRFSDERLLLEWYRLGETNGFLMFAR